MQQEPIDLSQLNELLSSADEVDALLGELLVQTHKDAAQLESALAKQDIPEVTRIAHRIKGAGRMVGANPLATAFERMEQEGKQGRIGFEAEAKAELVRLQAWLDRRLNPAAATGERGEKT
jgi:HPt (histidine-containing phosphotransfer) domain-containing protein